MHVINDNLPFYREQTVEELNNVNADITNILKERA